MLPAEKLLKCILALSFAVVVCGQLVQIVAHTRPEGSNFIQLECRETFPNGSRATVLNTQLLLFNETGDYVTSLLDREGITHEFSHRGIFSFDIDQRIEGYYYCSRDPGTGIPASVITLLAVPRQEEVPEYYEKHVGESVTLRSGVGEGALASHYSAEFYKTTSTAYTELTNVSRGEDYSLTISSLQLSDSGIYEPSVSITTENGEIFYYLQNPPPITLKVYKSPIIEVAPTPVVDNEGVAEVSFTCIATGGPSLRLSWFKDDKNLTKYAPPHYNLSSTDMNGGTKVVSTVTVHRPNYTDSGRFKCIACIMDCDAANFRAEETADLTIIESGFHLKTTITEHKQLQLWVMLKIPILLYPVAAIVYFRPAATPDQRPVSVTTYSIAGNTTLMVYQLESHDVPQKFREENFYVQVSLRVESVESPLVPNTLDAASTANLNEPTEVDCGKYETQLVGIIASSSVLGGIILLLGVVITLCCSYKCFKVCQRTYRRLRMPPEERRTLEQQNRELIELLSDPNLTGDNLREVAESVRELININKGLLAGDSPEKMDGQTSV